MQGNSELLKEFIAKQSKILEAMEQMIILNGILASEIIQITENTSKIARKDPPPPPIPPNCVAEHATFKEVIFSIIESIGGVSETTKKLKEKALKDLYPHLFKHET